MNIESIYYYLCIVKRFKARTGIVIYSGTCILTLRLVMNKRSAGRSIRLGVLLAAAIMLVAASSGCINASWTKDLLNPDKPHTVYKVKDKII